MDEPYLLQVGYFRLARNVSKLSNHPIKVGCVLTKKKPLIACANKLCSHPKFANGDDIRSSLHAEIRALIHCASEDLVDSVAYVYRETAKGEPALAKPCKFCMEALIERGIKKVFFSTSEFPYYDWMRI